MAAISSTTSQSQGHLIVDISPDLQVDLYQKVDLSSDGDSGTIYCMDRPLTNSEVVKIISGCQKDETPPVVFLSTEIPVANFDKEAMLTTFTIQKLLVVINRFIGNNCSKNIVLEPVVNDNDNSKKTLTLKTLLYG